MHPVIEPAERAVLEEKLRTVLGSGAATTALLKIIDAVSVLAEHRTAPDVTVVAPTVDPQTRVNTFIRDFTDDLVEVAEEPVPEVQVVESSP